MNHPQLYSTAARLVRTSLNIRPRERVCIITDTNKLSLAEVFLSVCAASDTQPVLVVMPPARQHGQEPPAVVAGAMKAADAVIQCVTYAITHTDATRDALAAGARVLVLRGVTEEMLMEGAIGADYDEVARLTSYVVSRLSGTSAVQVRSPAGTDISFSIAGRRAVGLSGKAATPGSFAAMPDGEAAIAPLEETAQGVIVFEHSMDNLGLLDAPIRVEVRGGRAIRISGGRSAERLRALIERTGNGADNLAEFAIGTNPVARLIGNMAEDKKLLGTVHFAVGDNHVLGGTVVSDLHLDGMVLRPTVIVDGRVLVDQGTIREEDG